MHRRGDFRGTSTLTHSMSDVGLHFIILTGKRCNSNFNLTFKDIPLVVSECMSEWVVFEKCPTIPHKGTNKYFLVILLNDISPICVKFRCSRATM